MRRFALAFVVAALGVGSISGARAFPLVATYTGVIFGTTDAFTASFHYDTKDLMPSTGNSAYLEAKAGTIQSATYTDPFRSLSFSLPVSFSKGEYDSTVYDQDGSVVEVDTVHAYSIVTDAGLLSLSFGGADDMGIVTLDADGNGYVTLNPQSFALTREVVSPVPLPSTAALLGAALLTAGIVGRTVKRSARAV